MAARVRFRLARHVRSPNGPTTAAGVGQTRCMNIANWDSMGHRVELLGEAVFVVDRPADHDTAAPPMLIVHGFPTSSVDWAPVLDQLGAARRVVLFDLPGFGLSAKPDRHYSIASAADTAAALIDELRLHEFDLVTHDMGDTVGGELLARSLDGDLTAAGEPVRIRRRVVSNGSIYLDMANLTDGQKALWSAPDEMLPAGAAPDAAMLQLALTATLAPPGTPGSDPDPEHLRAAAEAICASDGARLLPRLIRYLDDRSANEGRYTGAIESHPAPLGVVWGTEDPIAVIDMAHQLCRRRSDAVLTELDGAGHYPMIECPQRFASAVLSHLSG